MTFNENRKKIVIKYCNKSILWLLLMDVNLIRWDYCLDKIEFLKFNKSFFSRIRKWMKEKQKKLFFWFHTSVKSAKISLRFHYSWDKKAFNYHVFTVALSPTSLIWVNLWLYTSNSQDLFPHSQPLKQTDWNLLENNFVLIV